jgi:hypothetical protein
MNSAICAIATAIFGNIAVAAYEHQMYFTTALFTGITLAAVALGIAAAKAQA